MKLASFLDLFGACRMTAPIGDCRKTEVYNPAEDRWDAGPLLPQGGYTGKLEICSCRVEFLLAHGDFA